MTDRFKAQMIVKQIITETDQMLYMFNSHGVKLDIKKRNEIDFAFVAACKFFSILKGHENLGIEIEDVYLSDKRRMIPGTEEGAKALIQTYTDSYIGSFNSASEEHDNLQSILNDTCNQCRIIIMLVVKLDPDDDYIGAFIFRSFCDWMGRIDRAVRGEKFLP